MRINVKQVHSDHDSIIVKFLRITSKDLDQRVTEDHRSTNNLRSREFAETENMVVRACKVQAILFVYE